MHKIWKYRNLEESGFQSLINGGQRVQGQDDVDSRGNNWLQTMLTIANVRVTKDLFANVNCVRRTKNAHFSELQTLTSAKHRN